MGNTIRASVGFDGSSSSQELPSAGKTQRSTDYVDEGGLQMRHGPAGFSQTAHSADMVGDNDLITVDGMEVTGKMARELGLLGRVFDEKLSYGAAQRAALQEKQAAHQRITPEQRVLNELGAIPRDDSGDAVNAPLEDGRGDQTPATYTETTKGLREAVEGGTMSADEAVVYDTLAAEMAMAEIDAVEAAEMQLRLQTGEIDQSDVDPDTKQTLERFEKQVTDAAQKAVVEEVGHEGFNFIQQAAQSSPEVNHAVRNFAIMRATGRSEGLTWADFLRDAKDYLGHA